MLILTRRVGEFIIIELPTGERIQVAVLDAKGNQVRIGTDAPEDIAIIREELLQSDTTRLPTPGNEQVLPLPRHRKPC